jgi:hypothetical protein
MASETACTRPVYIWGPQFEFAESMNECGPCELYSLASLAEAFAFAPRLAASSASANLRWVKEGLGSDIISTDIQRSAISAANFGPDSAAIQWIDLAIRSSDATPLGRVDAMQKALARGEDFVTQASDDMAIFFGSFIDSGFDVLPMPEVALPVLLGLERLSIANVLLEGLETAVANQLKPLQHMMGSRWIAVPPLVALLLDRCGTWDDIPAELLALRKRFASARVELLKYELALAEAKTLGDHLDAIHDIEKVRVRIADVVAREERWGDTKSFVRHAWNIAKQGSLLKAATTAVDLALEPLLNRSTRRLAGHFIDIERQLREVRGYFELVERVFGESRVNRDAFRRFEPIKQRLTSAHQAAKEV